MLATFRKSVKGYCICAVRTTKGSNSLHCHNVSSVGEQIGDGEMNGVNTELH